MNKEIEIDKIKEIVSFYIESNPENVNLETII